MDGEERTIVVNVYTRARARRPRPPKLRKDAVCPDCGWQATVNLPNPRRLPNPQGLPNPATALLSQIPCVECGHQGLVLPTRVPAPFIKSAAQ